MKKSGRSARNVLISLKRLLGDDGPASPVAADLDLSRVAAELSAGVAGGEPGEPSAPPGPSIVKLAAFLDDIADADVTGEVQGFLASSGAAFQDALSSQSFIERMEQKALEAPADLVEGAMATWRRGRGTATPATRVSPVPALRVPGQSTIRVAGVPGAVPMNDTFFFQAAASDDGGKAIFCRSESGLWTLELFTDISDRTGNSGTMDLTVQPEYRAAYEGLVVRVSVRTPEGERVLAQALVSGGEAHSDVSLVGVEPRTRDAFNVVFVSAQDSR